MIQKILLPYPIPSNLMISKKTIDTILETAQIDQVVGDFVNLKRRGANLTGLCPFHHEKSPSFSVSTVRGIYKCFGCGKGGGALQFVMEHESCSYPEALRYLAQKYNIAIEEDQATDEYREKIQLADSLYIVNKAAQTYYSELLFNNKYAQDVALSYFKQRGLREDLIKRFELGFAHGEQADLVKHLQSLKFEPLVLEQAGLVNQYGKDFFRQRVLFPIHNLAAKVVGFGGRTMSADKSIPKYINSRETEIYIKNKTLYGLHIAKKTIQQKNEAWLTEGYMDVLSLHQAGFTHAVASAGTSLTDGQVLQLKKYAENVTILYDGDAAGLAAAEKAVNLFLAQDINPYVVIFPQPEDPDSYVRKVGAAAFETYINNNKLDFVSFKLQIAPDDPRNPLAKFKTLEEIVKLLAKIREPLKRAVFIKKTAQLFDMAEERINQEANKLISNQIQQQTTNSLSTPSLPTPHAHSSQEYQERDIIRLLIQFGQAQFSPNQSIAEFILDNMLDFIDEFENSLYSKIVLEYMDYLDQHQNQAPHADYFINHPQAQIATLAVDLLAPAVRYEFSPNWVKWNVYLQSQELPDLNHQKDSFYGVWRFKLRKMEKLCARNGDELKKLQFDTQNDEERYTNAMILLQVQMKLIGLKTEYALKTNTVVLK